LFHKNQATVNHCPKSLVWVKGLNMIGCHLFPKGVISSDTAVTILVPHSPQNDASHLGLGGPVPCSLSNDITPLHDRDTKGWISEEKTVLCNNRKS
jgi:hypothetical protein